MWRYAPKDNRTPVSHPLFGHLEWGTLVEDPACASDPDFVAVKPAKAKRGPATDPATAGSEPSGETPKGAGEPGGSKS